MTVTRLQSMAGNKTVALLQFFVTQVWFSVWKERTREFSAGIPSHREIILKEVLA